VGSHVVNGEWSTSDNLLESAGWTARSTLLKSQL
jgi:hypothetical protein